MRAIAQPTICRICDDRCGILVTDDAHNTVIRGNPDHPISKGFICFKGKNFGAVHRAPDRLTSPLKRDHGGWKEISYDEAVDTLVDHLLRVRDRYGPQSVIFYKGEALKHFEATQYIRHLANAFGSPNYISVASLCHVSKVMGHSLTYGGVPHPDFGKVNAVVIWGSNTSASYPRTFADLKKAVRRGTKLIVIDPSCTKAARLAHVHLPVRPASDGFLALAFLKYSCEEVGLKPDPNLAFGWEDISSMVAHVSYGELLQRTDIPESRFEQAAEMLFHNRPVWSLTGLGLQLQPSGVQSIRAVACLQSILDPDNRPRLMSAQLRSLPQEDRYPPMPLPIGANEAPLFTEARREGQGMRWVRAILDEQPYPLKAMLVAAGDPMVTFPSTQLQRKALDALDFLAVFDLFMTPTAQLADLIFPAADQLDDFQLHDYGPLSGQPYLGLMRPITRSPKGWPTWKLIFEIAHKLGLEHLFPWSDNREALRYRLDGSGVCLEQLEESPSATAAYTPQVRPEGRWNTPDGKVHYRCKALEHTGNPGLPVPESFGVPFSPDADFPFWLSTGDRETTYQHGQFRTISVYRRRCSEPYVDVHPDAALEIGIRTGDRVLVSTTYGRVVLTARISTELRKDCLRMTHGWEQANANELSGTEYFDPISGFPWLKALPARLEKFDQA